MLNNTELHAKILKETHHNTYFIHPNSTKMYQDLRQHYWWPGMKVEIAQYMARCLNRQQMKAKDRKPRELLNSMPIPIWKWANTTMDFVRGLPKSPRVHAAFE